MKIGTGWRSLRHCVFSVVITLLLGCATQACAQQETCEQCKYKRCIEDTIATKQQLIAAYQGIAEFWKKYNLDDNGSPLMVRNLAALPEPARSKVYTATASQLDQYARMEAARTRAIGRPESCGYDATTDLTVGTETFETCRIGAEIQASKDMQPCKQIADLIQQHENLHRATCQQRQKNYWQFVATALPGSPSKMLPGEIQTPAGKAMEEIAGYTLEITALNQILEKLKKLCRKVSFGNVTVDCVMNMGGRRVRMGQKIEGEVCGDPTLALWTIKPTYFTDGFVNPPSGNKPFETDCVAPGSGTEQQRVDIYRQARANGGGGGWICVYQAEPRPQITIRSFRLKQCEGAAEQIITVDAVVSESCDAPAPVRPAPVNPNRPNS